MLYKTFMYARHYVKRGDALLHLDVS
jgi:hypothetical protein